MTFTFKPRPGGRIRADIATAADGSHIWFSVTNTRAEHAGVFIPLDRVEEVIAGVREVARQQGGLTAPPRRRLTEDEHDAAWHAIEGTAAEEGADPGTVLAAVLRALGIDPPAQAPAAALAASCTHGLLPLGAGAVAPCLTQGPHLVHRSASGESWTNPEVDEP